MSEGAQFSIAADHPCLAGHFPGRPIVPGVLLLAHAIAAIEAEHGPMQPLRFPQVKFVQPLLPGEIAGVSFEPASARRWRFRVLREDGTLLASGEVSAA